MAVKFQFVSAFLCERVLFEQDNIVSAIRIIDIFQVPEGVDSTTLAFSFFAVVSLRLVPVPDAEVNVGITLVRVSGERESLPFAIRNPYKLREANPDPSLPGGISLIMQLQIVPKNFGTCYLEINVDGEVATTIPFTIRRVPAPLPVAQTN
jgi:hypothetical protein